eukprot:Gregarina_sp_Poly_1__2749@NODE_1761_length_3386_cov_65_622175_g1150_i0_p2_GENE_NODE_1761_length_3386_cov_65_622175_g1150_i0NODE_1761_length_3386_cov_65_622175_g1150_i0_p2_ORF_typecomplete_len488_score68_89Pescadillo_N/PF06732_11/1_9e92Pescadillo_N/PF06732_11/9e03BRCT_2/PF16589_5/3_9e08GBP_C/PF02841_14/0_00019CENPK/PF11802_8/1_8e03CENPK/PF11802_8/0_02BRCT/PF00533_26/0_41_NODE_1761_length_3386_cov_65_622175_g1150_i015182981
MVKKPWRPTKGEAGNYIQRAPALRKLGISLADFRRLCIIKGVFPRTPKKKLEGRHKVYYHVKDITHLAHEPLLDKFKEQKTLTKKIHKALSKNEPERAKSIFTRAPKFNLAHIIKERYPTLAHALRDLDDALSCLALFAILPVSNKDGIDGSVLLECRSLINQWMAWTAEIQCVDKVFASIKGYYYQVSLLGEKIVWLMPHEFTTKPADEVDLRVMATFLELYRTLVKFTMFKLYAITGYQYPPPQFRSGQHAEGDWMNLAMNQIETRDTVIADGVTDTPLLDASDQSVKRRHLFENKVIYVSRETPIKHMCYCIKACGATRFGFDENLQAASTALSSLKINDPSITHHIVDRPTTALQQLCQQIPCEMRTFAQPQWLFDSLNMAKVLPTTPYSPGVHPPAHLSPFVDDRVEGYVPAEKILLAEWAGEDTEKLKAAEQQEEADLEERARRVAVLPRKKRELAQRVEAKEQSRKEKVKKLKNKKAAAA